MVNSVVLATDGSCLRRAGPGGWAAILQQGSAEAVYAGGSACTNSYRMELTALLHGLNALATLSWPHPAALTVLTDCEPLAQGLNGQMARWAARDWHRVKDNDLWQAIAATLPACPIQATWVPSRHHPLNQHVDALARSAALFADRAVLHPAICWE